MLRSIGLPELLILLVFVPVLIVIPFWKIFRKAGFPGALSILVAIPFAGLIVVYVVAYSDWPALRNRQQP
jgi:hypothetical protein